jgi:hypothetical protein
MCSRQLHITIIQGFIEAVYSLIRMAPDPQFLDIPNNFRQVSPRSAQAVH